MAKKASYLQNELIEVDEKKNMEGRHVQYMCWQKMHTSITKLHI